MKRVLVLASHHLMADGLKDTLDFISGGAQETKVLCAYMDNQPVDEAVDALMAEFDAETEVVVLTDLNSGSVNQKFFKHIARPHTHLVSGMSLPLALVIALEDDSDYIGSERMREIVEGARTEIRYVNDAAAASEEDEEDE